MSTQNITDADGARIARIRRRYQTEIPVISIERARLYTDKWRELENGDTPLPVRAALAMKHVYENMTHHVDGDDRIAGNWCEHFLGLPVDVERGLFNGVLATEFDKSSMIAFQAKSYARFVKYMLKKHGPLGLYRIAKKNAALGPTPVNIGLKTLPERAVNAFTIDPRDKEILQKELLPYWKGRCIADIVAEKIEQSDLYTGDMADFAAAVPSTPSKQALIVSLGAAIATYQGHLVLDHETVLRRGLLAMREDVQKAIDTHAGGVDEMDFLRSVQIAMDGVIIYANRLCEKLESELEKTDHLARKAVIEQMLENCRRAALHPAESFRQAVQSLWTHKAAVELAHITNVHAVGRVDQLLYPYYEKDLAKGLITPEQARELLEELLLKIMVQNLRPESNLLGNFYLRYEGSTPVTIGGLNEEGKDAANDLTYLVLDAADRSKCVTSIVLRVHENTPEELYMAAARVLHRGTSNLSLMNDEIFVDAMQRRGFSLRDSRNYAITGCTDLLSPGNTGGISFSGLLLGRVLDMTLRNGDAATLIGVVKGLGPRTGAPESFTNFEQLLDAFITQIDNMIRVNVEASNLRDELFARYMPAPYISAFIKGCLENKKDVTQGGATYNFAGINMINSVANVVDSLYVIKKLVFDDKRYTLTQIMRAVDDNFDGHDEIHEAVLNISGKWGNGAKECDELARKIMSRVFAAAEKYKAFKGGGFAPFINSMTSHTMDGRVSVATPDGRRAATPYAASCNPYNVEGAGLTGVLRSVAALDFKPILGCAVNLRLHPTAIGETEESRAKWIALMRAYFKMGGAQVQPTVASAETLRAAQKNPDNYRDLMVKVGGYSTYFVDLGREIQNEVISRTEHAC